MLTSPQSVIAQKQSSAKLFGLESGLLGTPDIKSSLDQCRPHVRRSLKDSGQ